MTSFAELRRGAGLSLAEAASDFGSHDDVVAWESGASKAPVHVIRALEVLSIVGPSSEEGGDVAASPVVPSPDQQVFPWVGKADVKPSLKGRRTGAFTDNMRLPIHRWFRYSAGFSAEWVSGIIRNRGRPASSEFLFDPFAGSGTSLLAAQSADVPSAGAERHPFVQRIARAKLDRSAAPSALRAGAQRLLARARASRDAESSASDLLLKCYSPDALARLESLRIAHLETGSEDLSVSELLWLAITSILRECSEVGTAQWQYVLPNKTKARVSDPYLAFERRVEMFAADLALAGRVGMRPAANAEILADDARSLDEFAHLKGQVSLVVTSPPYPNNYDYADATRLEMTFWREVGSWGDLQRTVRHKLVRSCSQHSAAERLSLDSLLEDPAVEPIRAELTEVCRELEAVRETRGGRKTYHTMVAAYFADLAKVWHALRPLCVEGADICFVIGDSAPYGVYVPVDRWLNMLAIEAGFHSPRFEKVRDRNLKWKNRKHRVPLKEGNLWLKG